MRTIALFLLLTASAAAQSSGPKYGPHTIGETPEQFATIAQVPVPQLECIRPLPSMPPTCRQISTKNEDGIDAVYMFEEKKLNAIRISYNLRDKAIDFDNALLKQMGEPTTTWTLVNGFGGPLGIASQWSRPDGGIVVRIHQPHAPSKEVSWTLK